MLYDDLEFERIVEDYLNDISHFNNKQIAKISLKDIIIEDERRYLKYGYNNCNNERWAVQDNN